MPKKITILAIAFCAVFLTSCISINSMPQSASEIDFDSTKEGRTGWSQYEEVFFLNGVDLRTTYLAAKSGLANAGFTIKRADYSELFAIGEHGMTKYDWNIVAGVYIRKNELRKGSEVKILIKGSKDLGFWGDMTANSWPQNIFQGMRNYIATESQILDPNKKLFQ
ncbi:hypothetical protein N9C35_03880 [Flavobacteriaceae bacterium]|nr:hypothetical protein [Flavobacteriaceae bacterium]